MSKISEKRQEDIVGGEVDPDAQFGGTEARKKLERRLLWKIDARMSVLLVIYILNYVDRNNVSAARLRGFESDLGLQGQQFATILSILYVGYIIMQVPSNMFLNKIGRPSIYLPCCMIIWGMISVLTGITTNFVGALLTRFFLGFVEAAFLPGSLFLLSKWYTRSEIGLRSALLFCGNIISNAFGTLMASGILARMDGKLGHPAWRWLFYIEGSMTMAIATLAILILPDFPSNTRWLSDQERSLALLRMSEDVGVSDEAVASRKDTSAIAGLVQALTDWRVWFMSLTLTSEVVALSFNAFFPTLTATLGYSSTVSLLLCAPPWVFAALVAFPLSRHSDKTQERCWHITASYLLGLIGFIIAISTMNTAARYVSLFLMAQSYAGFIVFYAWLSNSFPRPAAKRAVVLALTNAFSQLGNVAGSYVWPSTWGPTYEHSYAICIATSGLSILMCWVFRMELGRMNGVLERREREEMGDGEGEEGIEQFGGHERGFRYIL